MPLARVDDLQSEFAGSVQDALKNGDNLSHEGEDLGVSALH
jgi:hypothetical protein